MAYNRKHPSLFYLTPVTARRIKNGFAAMWLLLYRHIFGEHADICVLFVSLSTLSCEAQASSSACLSLTNGGLQGHEEESGAVKLRAYKLPWLEAQGPAAEEQEVDNWLHCFLQPAVVPQCTVPTHTS